MPINFVSILTGVLLTSYLLLTFYLEHKLTKLQTLDSAKRLKYVAYTSFYLLLVLWALLVTRLIIATRNIATNDQSPATSLIDFDYIILVVMMFLSTWLIKDEVKRYNWFRKKTLSAVLVSSLFDKHLELLKAHNFEQSKDCLIKACEVEPNSVMLWSSLGHFYEVFLNNKDESDQCMNKAKSILESSKEPDQKDIACYENYFGYILCNRGQTEEGLKHIEKSIELDPNPGRIGTCNEKLAELKQQNQTIQD